MKKIMIGLLLALSSLTFSEEEIKIDKNLTKYASRIEVHNSMVEMVYESNSIKIRNDNLAKLDKTIEDYNQYRLTKAFYFLINGLSHPDNTYYIIEGDYYENDKSKNKINRITFYNYTDKTSEIDFTKKNTKGDKE